jgi:acyl carrier protein
VSSLEQRLRSIVAGVAGCEPEVIDVDVPLFRGGLELDSLAGAELILQIERECGISIADEDLDLEALFSLRTLCRFVSRMLAQE